MPSRKVRVRVVGLEPAGRKAAKWAAAALVAITLTGCSNAVADAEERYKIVERSGTKGELCRAAREVADAYLQAKNESQYSYWRAVAGMRCQLAEFDGPNSLANDSEAAAQATAAAEAAAQSATIAAEDVPKASAGAN